MDSFAWTEFINSKDLSLVDFNYFISILDLNQLLLNSKPSQISSFLTKLSSLLTSKLDYNRWAFTRLINITISQCPLACQDKIPSWINGILSNLKKDSSIQHIHDNLNCLLTLFKAVKNSPEASKITNHSAFSNLINTFSHIQAQHPDAITHSLYTLSSIMALFPTSLRPFRQVLDKTVSDALKKAFLTNDMGLLASVAEICIDIDIMNTNDKSIQKKDSTIQSVLDSLSYLLSRLLLCVDEDKHVATVSIPENEFTQYLKSVTFNDYMVQLPKAITAFNYICIFLKNFLSSGRFQSQNINIDLILNYADRIYDISSNSSSTDGRDPAELQSLIISLPNLYLAINSTLETIITNLQDVMSQRASNILDICTRALERSKFRDVRVSALSLLNCCIQYIPSILEISTNSLTCLLQKEWEALPMVPTEFLEKTNDNSKKRRIQMRDTSLTKDYSIQLYLPERSISLKVLNSIIKNSIQYEIPQSIIQEITKDLIKITTMEEISKNNDIYQYHILLITVIQALLSGIYSRAVMPFALRMFSKSLHSKNIKVSYASKDALVACDLVIHPQLPQLIHLNDIDLGNLKSNETENAENNSKIESNFSLGNSKIESNSFNMEDAMQQMKPSKNDNPEKIHQPLFNNEIQTIQKIEILPIVNIEKEEVIVEKIVRESTVADHSSDDEDIEMPEINMNDSEDECE